MKALTHIYEYFFVDPPFALGDGMDVFIVKVRRVKDEAILRQAMAAARRMTNTQAKRKVEAKLLKGRDIHENPLQRAYQVHVEHEHAYYFRVRLFSVLTDIYGERIKRNAKQRNRRG